MIQRYKHVGLPSPYSIVSWESAATHSGETRPVIKGSSAELGNPAYACSPHPYRCSIDGKSEDIAGREKVSAIARAKTTGAWEP